MLEISSVGLPNITKETADAFLVLKRVSPFWDSRTCSGQWLIEPGQPWVWGVTRPTKGEAGGEWMTNSGTGLHTHRLRVVVIRFG